MNAYYDPLAVQVIYAERIRNSREPIVLGQPKRARRRTRTNETSPTVFSALRSAARAVASFLM